jgi:hypothetical protein
LKALALVLALLVCGCAPQKEFLPPHVEKDFKAKVYVAECGGIFQSQQFVFYNNSDAMLKVTVEYAGRFSK